MSRAAASSDLRALSVGAVRPIGLAAGAIAPTASAATAVPPVKAIATTPAEPAAVGVAAPIEARTLPAAIVPAEIAPPEEELDAFQRRRVASSIDAKDKLR